MRKERYKFTDKDFSKIEDMVDSELSENLEWAEKQESPCPKSFKSHLFSADEYTFPKEINYISDRIVMVDAINHALDEELSHNDNMIILISVFFQMLGSTQVLINDNQCYHI